MADTNAGTYRSQLLLDISNAMAGYTKLRQEHLSTFSAMAQGAGTLDRLGNGFILMGAAAVGALIGAGKQWGDFERKIDYMAVVADASGSEVTKLSKLVQQLGADTIYTNGEVADGFTELAKAGVGAKDILGGIGEGITHLGAAADIGLAESA